eukprot:1323218-Pyramimonas_sp.AAC.1
MLSSFSHHHGIVAALAFPLAFRLTTDAHCLLRLLSYDERVYDMSSAGLRRVCCTANRRSCDGRKNRRIALHVTSLLRRCASSLGTGGGRE